MVEDVTKNYKIILKTGLLVPTHLFAVLGVPVGHHEHERSAVRPGEQVARGLDLHHSELHCTGTCKTV